MARRKKSVRFSLRQSSKKYKTRPSPPFKARSKKGKTCKGNDGHMWKSRSFHGVYKWVRRV